MFGFSRAPKASIMFVDSNIKAGSRHFITADEFARLARISRRTLDRYRQDRPSGFPTEYDIGRGAKPRPRFKFSDVQRWLDSRALW
jgi:predicted DNA-binding transcriptional regulator AlpA